MRTIEITAYAIGELEDRAKDSAHNQWMQSHEYFWHDENKKSLETFAEEFGITIRDWSYGGRGEGVFWTKNFDDEYLEMSGHRLAKYLWNNFSYLIAPPKYMGSLKTNEEVFHKRIRTTGPFQNGNRHHAYLSAVFTGEPNLTGYCVDYSLLKPIVDFVAQPNGTTFEELIDECFSQWVRTCNEDLEYSYSMEYFEEECEANEWEFDEDGHRVN